MSAELMQLQGFRVSPQQRHLWLLQPANGLAYHARCTVFIEGELDREALKLAVRTVVERHEILRTVFVRTPGVKVPLQVVSPEPDFQWSEDAGTPEGEFAAALLSNAWNHERGPMLRLKLLALAKAKHLLFIALPALCSDSTGLKNLVHEIARALTRNTDDEVTQYIDLAQWQNELFESDDARTGREFWLTQNLTPSVNRLPFEKESAGVFAPAVIATKVDTGLTSALAHLVEQQQTSVSQVLLACWQLLLWRYFEQPNLVIGASFDGRNYEELETALGLFAKYLPLQTEVNANTCFSEQLRRTARSVKQIEHWQESFNWNAIESGDAEAPHFPFCFDFVNLGGRHSIAGLTISILDTHTCIDRFNLKLCGLTNDECLRLEFHYDSSRFKPHDVERLAGQFVELLANAVAQPEAAVNRLNMVTEAERPQVLPRAIREQQTACVHQLFEKQVELTPDAVVLEFEGESLTYAQLNVRANQIAARLRALGAGPESVVAICMERSFEMMASLLGILKAGACYLPLDPSYPEQRLEFLLEDAKPIVVLTADRLREMLAGGSEDSLTISTEVSGENLAYIIYTSGSTGKPKGVMIPHAGLTNYLEWSLAQYSVSEGTGVPLHSPLTFDLTVTALFAPLLAGRKVVLLNEKHTIDSLAKGEGFSFVKVTPAHLEALNQLLPAERAAHYTRALIVGGEALYGENLEFWKRNAPATRIINEYGPTETVVGCCVFETEAVSVEPGPVSIGRAISNMEVYLLNSELQPAPIGVPGEIFIRGIGLARGYLNRPELTAECFIPSPFSPGERLYRTGDLARYLPDGAIQFIGRSDHQVKLRGHRIELGEIESVLGAHAAVREAVAVLSENASAEKRLVAYVVAAHTTTESDLHDYVRDRLPEYMIPTVIVLLDKLPLTAHGKVDRSLLTPPENAPLRQPGTHVAPRTKTEKILAAMWSEVLGVDRVGVNDNFFDLGGHSLLATRIIARLNQTFHIELPMYKLLEMPTVAGLAAAVIESRVNGHDSEETGRVLAELEQLSDQKAETLLTEATGDFAT